MNSALGRDRHLSLQSYEQERTWQHQVPPLKGCGKWLFSTKNQSKPVILFAKHTMRWWYSDNTYLSGRGSLPWYHLWCKGAHGGRWWEEAGGMWQGTQVGYTIFLRGPSQKAAMAHFHVENHVESGILWATAECAHNLKKNEWMEFDPVRWNLELWISFGKKGDLESVIKIAILFVNSDSGTYFFHQFDGQVNQWQNLSSADDFCNQLAWWQSAMHWQNNWFCSPSFDDKTMQKCLWCTAIDETGIFHPWCSCHDD